FLKASARRLAKHAFLPDIFVNLHKKQESFKHISILRISFMGCTVVATGKLTHFTRDGITTESLPLATKILELDGALNV
ncbi:hypothetical protein AALD74_24165, partial [Lachnospiraceae bacterium 48-21]